MSAAEISEAPACYCGKRGCLETWCSGPGVAAEFERVTRRKASAEQIAVSDGAEEQAALVRLADRLARGLATVCNIIDPDVVVLGGGMSNVERLYDNVPRIWNRYVVSDYVDTRLLRNVHGDSSGVRGAAWLWGSGDAKRNRRA